MEHGDEHHREQRADGAPLRAIERQRGGGGRAGPHGGRELAIAGEVSCKTDQHQKSGEAEAGMPAVDLRQQIYGWHAGFGLAGLLMLIGLATYLAGYRELSASVRTRPAAAAALPLDRAQWRTIGALFAVMFITMFQSIAYYQNSNVALIWIDRSVDLELLGYRIPTGWFNSIDPFVSIVAVPFLLALWRRQALRGAEPAEIAKIGTGAWIACAANLLRRRGVRRPIACRSACPSPTMCCSEWRFSTIGRRCSRSCRAHRRRGFGHLDGNRVPVPVSLQCHHRPDRRGVRTDESVGVLGAACGDCGGGRRPRVDMGASPGARARAAVARPLTDRLGAERAPPLCFEILVRTPK